jgi:cytochrome b561
MSKMTKLGANIGHGMLYLLMIAIPLSGWLMSSAKGFQTVYFGVLPIPDLVSKDKAIGDALEAVHMILNYSMAAILVGHIGAAIKHHVVDKDDVLRRMLPWRAR